MVYRDSPLSRIVFLRTKILNWDGPANQVPRGDDSLTVIIWDTCLADYTAISHAFKR